MAVQTTENARLRGLKVLVGVLGVLIVLGTAVVIGVVIKRIYARPAAASMAALPAGVVPEVPAGDHIAGIAGAGGVFAVWVTGGGGGSVYLLDPQTGALRLAVSTPR
jgi:hypothetical protein